MAQDNPAWGERRIAAELLVKLGLRVSPRTVRRYMPTGTGVTRRGAPSHRWRMFLRNHASVLLASDFCVVVTARFRVLYVFVVMEIGSRRLVHINVTGHPTAAWTLQQFREVLAAPHAYRFALHDRDSIYSPWLDAAVTAMGVRILRTPIRAPQANAYCERLLGSLRSECLDFLILLGEEHLRRILVAWKMHSNRGRPPASLGPGLPEPSPGLPAAPIAGHHLPRKRRLTARPILGGLHHEYGLEKVAA
jgi:putative transposase